MTPLLTPVVPPVYWRQANPSNGIGMFGCVAGAFFRISHHSCTLAVGVMLRCLSLATIGSNCFLGNFRWSRIWATTIFLIFVFGWRAIIRGQIRSMATRMEDSELLNWY